MKRVIALSVLIFFCLTLIAQEEVTFNFSNKWSRGNSKTKVTFYVNGIKAVKLKNGDTYVYKATLDVSRPVTVKAKFSLNKQEITFTLSQGNKCSLESSFFGGMLDLNLISGGRINPGTGSKSSLLVSKKDLSVSYNSEKVNATDTIRLHWLEKGGKIKGMSYVGGATFTTMNESGMKMTGYGGTFAVTQTYLNFRVPENKPGIRTWISLVYGFSETFQVYGENSTMTIEGMDPMTSSLLNTEMTLSPNFGFTLGLGKFKNDTKWKGAAFAISYKPSLTFSHSLNLTKNPITGEYDASQDISFNYMGYGFDINFNNYTSNASRLAPKAQSKISFFMLPPIKKVPLFISVGYGLTFYIRRK